MAQRNLLVAVVSLLGLACTGVPEDTRVESLEIQAWGGNVAVCREMAIDLDLALVASGGCDAVDASTGTAVPPQTVEALRAGIDESEFRPANVEPTPGCATCPTRSYRVQITSESEGISRSSRILPSQGLLDALAPMGAP
jgi:hypothetical protein